MANSKPLKKKLYTCRLEGCGLQFKGRAKLLDHQRSSHDLEPTGKRKVNGSLDITEMSSTALVEEFAKVVIAELKARDKKLDKIQAILREG